VDDIKKAVRVLQRRFQSRRNWIAARATRFSNSASTKFLAIFEWKKSTRELRHFGIMVRDEAAIGRGTQENYRQI